MSYTPRQNGQQTMADSEPVVIANDQSAIDVNIARSGAADPEAPVTVNLTASGEVIATPGAGNSLYIVRGSIHNADATDKTVQLLDGSVGTSRFKALVASDGGGTLFNFGPRGWKLTANTELYASLDSTGDIDINVTEYYIAT